MSTVNTLAAALMARWAELHAGERGQGLVEYTLLVALIAVVSVLVLRALGVEVFGSLNDTQNNMPVGSTPVAPS